MHINSKEFEELIIRYETISYKEICEAFKKYKGNTDKIKPILTGYGNQKTCTLCRSAHNLSNGNDRCGHCVYGYKFCSYGFPCLKKTESIKRTYDMIEKAYNPMSLFRAYWIRAKAMREFYKDEFGKVLK